MYSVKKPVGTFQSGNASAFAFGVTVTAHASAHTKGSYTDMLSGAAITTSESLWQIWHFNAGGGSGLNFGMLCDVAVAPSAGSERVLMENLLVSRTRPQNDGISPMTFVTNFRIAKGMMIRARCQAGTGGNAVRAFVFLHRGFDLPNFPLLHGCHAYGISTAGSTGTTITPGANGGWSSWQNVGSTTSRPYKGIMFIHDGQPTTVASTIAYHWEVGYGSTALYGRSFSDVSTGEDRMSPMPNNIIPASIPAGVQLQVRGRATSGGGPPNQVCGLYLFY